MHCDIENSDSFWGGHLFSLRPGSSSVIELPVPLTYEGKYFIKEREDHAGRRNPTSKSKYQETLSNPQ